MIDAFRSDFLYSPNTVMEFLKSKIDNEKCAVPLIALASAPTVTLPRLKALLTGSNPNFLDFLQNFDESSSLNSSQNKYNTENWIHNAHLQGKKILFCGDDTWLRFLGPDVFSYSRGVSSFYVNDTERVDSVVTKCSRRTIVNHDWDIMVLHYLGLDHTGHCYGASGPKIDSKLVEMDKRVEKLYELVSQKDAEDGKETLIVVLGDHGMTESGNHGGASPAECMTACLFLRTNCVNNTADDTSRILTVNQLDIATTLPLLLGVPIPKNSSGALAQQLLQRLNLPNDQILELAQTNLAQLKSLQHPTSESTKTRLGDDTNGVFKEIGKLSKLLSVIETDYDFKCIFLGLFALLISLAFFALNFANTLDWVMIVYAISQFSSSFIEEEYLIWFFALQTVLFWRAKHFSKFKLVISMILTRFLFTANPNGYLSIDDFTLKKFASENIPLQSSLLFISLSYFSISNNNSCFELFAKLPLSIAALLYHLSPYFHTVFFARICLVSSLACMIFLDPWFGSKIIAVLLSRSHNSLVVMLLEILKNSVGDSPLTHTLLLHFSFFATGSSHLISAIDLPNAYIWLNSFMPILVGITLFLLTWIGPISLTFPRDKGLSENAVSPFGRIFVFLILAISAVLQRYHLFVWTVFTPRIIFRSLMAAFLFSICMVPEI